MPLYEVEHIIPLTDQQQDELAEAITRIHSEKFTTPRLFVNVNFIDASNQKTYVAGKRSRNNRITANVRHGPSRTQEMYADITAELTAEWNRIVSAPGQNSKTNGHANTHEKELRAIFVLGSIVTAREAGFMVPPAGGDREWLKENYPAFKKIADDGDEDFKDMVEELHTRPVFAEILKS